jgi:hypothetical protein
MGKKAMARTESPVVQARRHVIQFERRVERQKQLIEELERDKHPAVAAQGRRVLEVLEESLRLARVHLQLEIDHYGEPSKEA